MSLLDKLKCPYWLIASIAIYLITLLRVNDSAQFAMALLYCAALTQIAPIRTVRVTVISPMVRWLGYSLLSLTCLMLSWLIATHNSSDDVMNSSPALTLTRSAPMLIGLASAVAVDGWIGVHRWRRHLKLAICLGIPMLLLVNLVDLSPWTAATSEYLLRWSGYDAARNGVHLRVGAGPAVRVYPGCSGVEAVSYLFGLAFVCLETFPTGRRHYVWLPIVAALMGFVTNSIRVSLMAILLASDNRDAFTYWHIGEGSQLFGIAAVILLGCIYALTMWLTTASNDEVTVK